MDFKIKFVNFTCQSQHQDPASLPKKKKKIRFYDDHIISQLSLSLHDNQIYFMSL